MSITREDPRFWDVRTLERRMRRNQLTRKDYDKHLKSLPDAAEKAAPVDTSDEAAAEPPEPPEAAEEA